MWGKVEPPFEAYQCSLFLGEEFYRDKQSLSHFGHLFSTSRFVPAQSLHPQALKIQTWVLVSPPRFSEVQKMLGCSCSSLTSMPPASPQNVQNTVCSALQSLVSPCSESFLQECSRKACPDRAPGPRTHLASKFH